MSCAERQEENAYDPRAGQTGNHRGKERKVLRGTVTLLVLAAQAPGCALPTTGTADTGTFSNPQTIQVPDVGPAFPYPSSVTVTGLSGVVSDVNVTLRGVNHINPDDLDIVLVAPGGQNAVVMSDAGGSDDAVNNTLALDDSAASPVPDSVAFGSSPPSQQPTDYEPGDTYNERFQNLEPDTGTPSVLLGGQIGNLYDTAEDIVEPGVYRAFGIMDQFPSGRFVMAYRRGTSHAGAGDYGTIEMRTSADGGRTWSGEKTIASEAGVDLRFSSSGGVAPDGTLVVFYGRYDPDTSTALNQGYIYSTDEGATWSEFTPIPVGSETVFLPYGPMVQIADGKLMQGWYGWHGSTYSTYVLFSSDNGRTWGDQATVLSSDVLRPTEASYFHAGGGTLFGLIRLNDGTTFRQVRSDDNGATWVDQGDTTFDTWRYPSPPTLVAYRTPSGSRAVRAYYVNRTALMLRAVQALADDLQTDQTAAWGAPRDLRSVHSGDSGYVGVVHPFGDGRGYGWFYDRGVISFFSDSEPGVTYSDPAPLPPHGQAFTELNGGTPNGSWSLFVFDDFFNIGGQNIAGGWTLKLTTQPAPEGQPPPNGDEPAAVPPVVVSNAFADPRTFAVDKQGQPETQTAVPTGPSFRYTLSEAAQVTFLIERQFKGQKKNGVCKPKPEKGKCKGFRAVGSFQAWGQAGANAEPVSGLIGLTALKRGKHRATVTATDASGLTSAPVSFEFRVENTK